MRPEPAFALRRLLPLRLCAPVTTPPGVAVAVGVPCGATTVSTGEAKGVGEAAVLKGVAETAGVAVWVAVDVGVGVCVVAVGVGVAAVAVFDGVTSVPGVPVAVADAVGVGSCASAAPPITAA
jgi:hypothetical protein